MRGCRTPIFATQSNNLVSQSLDLVGHSNQTVPGAGDVSFHVSHHFTMAPPQGAAGVGAFLVVHWKRFVKRVEMDLSLIHI